MQVIRVSGLRRPERRSGTGVVYLRQATVRWGDRDQAGVEKHRSGREKAGKDHPCRLSGRARKTRSQRRPRCLRVWEEGPAERGASPVRPISMRGRIAGIDSRRPPARDRRGGSRDQTGQAASFLACPGPLGGTNHPGDADSDWRCCREAMPAASATDARVFPTPGHRSANRPRLHRVCGRFLFLAAPRARRVRRGSPKHCRRVLAQRGMMPPWSHPA